MSLSEVRKYERKKKTFFKDHSSASLTPLAVKISLMFIFIRLSFFIAQKNSSKRFLPSGNFDSHYLPPPTHWCCIKLPFFKKREKKPQNTTLHEHTQFACIQSNSREGGGLRSIYVEKCAHTWTLCTASTTFLSLIHRLNIDQNVCTQKFALLGCSRLLQFWEGALGKAFINIKPYTVLRGFIHWRWMSEKGTKRKRRKKQLETFNDIWRGARIAFISTLNASALDSIVWSRCVARHCRRVLLMVNIT